MGTPGTHDDFDGYTRFVILRFASTRHITIVTSYLNDVSSVASRSYILAHREAKLTSESIIMASWHVLGFDLVY